MTCQLCRRQTNPDSLPLIEDIARLFPNEWLAFTLSPEEAEEAEPTRGQLIAHSLRPNEVHDALNAVGWCQHVYLYFNGDFAAMQATYDAL
jgi:hypothetical protein